MKIIVAFLLFAYSVSPAFATFDKYHSDEVSLGSSSNISLWIVGFIFAALILFGSKDVRRSAIFFIALFAFPIVGGYIGREIYGSIGGLIGGLLGLFAWYKSIKLMDD